MSETIKEKAAKGFLWSGISNFSMQLLNALFGICLLNMLTPEDYGTVAVLAIFSGIATAIQDSGFYTALANKKTPSHEEYNAVFWFNIICGCCLYLLLFLAAPWIADFYDEPILKPLSRFVFLGFLISSFGIAQRAYLFINLMVKESAVISITALVISGITGITLAFFDFAYWGLAAQNVVFILVVVLMNWYYSPWRPSFSFTFHPIKEMFPFSSKILVTTLFNQANRHVFSVLLGKYYGKRTAGLYSNANKWNEMGMHTINGMVSGVVQPILTQVKDDLPKYRQVFRKMLRFTSFIAFPSMLGLGFIAEEFIVILTSGKWIESAVLLSILSIYGAFYPITTLYSIAVISHGKSDINLFNTVILCLIVWGLLIGLHSFGLTTMMTAFVCINVLWLGVWHYFLWKLTHLSFWDALKDMLPFLSVALLSICITGWATQGIGNIYLLLFSKIAGTAGLYLGILRLLGANILQESIEYLFKKRKE